MSDPLPAIKLAEEIMLMIFQSDVDVDECNKATRAIAQYDAGEGTIWGVMDLIERDGRDGKFYRLKAEVVDFIRELQSHKDYYLIAALHMKKMQEMTKLD